MIMKRHFVEETRMEVVPEMYLGTFWLVLISVGEGGNLATSQLNHKNWSWPDCGEAWGDALTGALLI